jgi:hypothetical protein
MPIASAYMVVLIALSSSLVFVQAVGAGAGQEQ